jgi:hypothetical protein
MKDAFSTEYKHPSGTDCVSGRLLKSLGRLYKLLAEFMIPGIKQPSFESYYLPALGLATQLLLTSVSSSLKQG